MCPNSPGNSALGDVGGRCVVARLGISTFGDCVGPENSTLGDCGGPEWFTLVDWIMEGLGNSTLLFVRTLPDLIVGGHEITLRR